ncbi:major facilitator superfamily domain-containing protein [Fennellomyces sp. T-0311]|nr:major facilitator superfamily domain-containing protein [Fennellomyces sp. T-0311]
MSINATVIAPALSIIPSSLDAIEEQTWVVTSFIIGMNCFQPIAGKFSDIFGRKPILLMEQLAFIIGSLITLVTPTMNGLIAGRGIQGVGSGTVTSTVFVIVVDVAPLDWRPRMQALLIVVYGISSVVGPLVGGAFVDNLSWRWIFRMNIIVTVLLFKESSKVRKESLWIKIKRIDYLGILFSTSFVTCILLAISWGPRYGWNNAHSIGPFVAAFVSLVLLIVSEGWISKEPLMPPRIILDPKVFLIYLYLCCLGFGFASVPYFGPMLFQAVFGATSTESGVRLIPFMACLIAGAIASGISMKFFLYIKLYTVAGAALNVLGLGLFHTVNESSSWGTQACFLPFCGLTMGWSQQNCVLSVQMVVEEQYLAVATVLSNFFLFLSVSMAIGVYQVLLSTFLSAQISSMDSETLAVSQQYEALTNHLLIRDMPIALQGPIISAYMSAFRYVFIIPLVIAGIALVCAIFLPNVRFTVSPQQPTDPSISKDKETADSA